MIFLDGVGIGEPDPEKNIFFKRKFKFLENIFGSTPSLENQYLEKNGCYLFPSDANLGIPELPQSGTGQTSIFCGFNAPQELGKHFGPYPHTSLVPLIEEKNIFKAFLDRGQSPAFANAYPKIFFDYVDSGKRRLSVTSLSCLLSGVTLKNTEDLRTGDALSAEIDNSRWISSLGYDLPLVKPEEAAERLMTLAKKHDFTLFEYFYTDHIGHFRIKDIADHTLNVLDDFLYYILANLDEELTLLICSDHGNIEDMSVKMHTRNPALTITAGKNAAVLKNKIKKLTDIKSAILENALE